jgi:hypothetical protein
VVERLPIIGKVGKVSPLAIAIPILGVQSVDQRFVPFAWPEN